MRSSARASAEVCGQCTVHDSAKDFHVALEDIFVFNNPFQLKIGNMCVYFLIYFEKNMEENEIFL